MPVRTVESPSVTESIKELALGSPPVLSPAQILASLSLPEKVFLLSGSSFTRTPGIARHGLNPVKVSDGPTDVRGDGVFNAPPSIVLPNATCLASTWDVELIQQAGQSLAGEAAHKTVDIMLAPTLNLHRDPRGGRNQESYGEDPFLAGKCGAAFAKGPLLRCDSEPC
jgi:beta-glucosidase